MLPYALVGDVFVRAHDGDVVAAEPEGIIDCGEVTVGKGAWFLGDIDAEARLLLLEVDRRRHHSVTQREYARKRLKRARSTEEMAGHGFRRRHHGLRVVTQRSAN